MSTIVLSDSSIVEEVARAVAEEGKLGRLNGKNYEKSKKPTRAVRSASPSPVKKAKGIVSNYGKDGVQRRNSDFAVAPPTAWNNLKPLQVKIKFEYFLYYTYQFCKYTFLLFQVTKCLLHAKTSTLLSKNKSAFTRGGNFLVAFFILLLFFTGMMPRCVQC